MPPSTLYVTGFAKGTKAEEIGNLFEKFGAIRRVDIPPPRTDDGQQYAFIEYIEVKDAEDALDQTKDGFVCEYAIDKERGVVVQMARSEPYSVRNYRGRGGFSGRSRGGYRDRGYDRRPPRGGYGGPPPPRGSYGGRYDDRRLDDRRLDDRRLDDRRPPPRRYDDGRRPSYPPRGGPGDRGDRYPPRERGGYPSMPRGDRERMRDYAPRERDYPPRERERERDYPPVDRDRDFDLGRDADRGRSHDRDDDGYTNERKEYDRSPIRDRSRSPIRDD